MIYRVILFNAAGEGGLCMDFNTSLNSDPQLSWAVWSDTLSVVFFGTVDVQWRAGRQSKLLEAVRMTSWYVIWLAAWFLEWTREMRHNRSGFRPSNNGGAWGGGGGGKVSKKNFLGPSGLSLVWKIRGIRGGGARCPRAHPLDQPLHKYRYSHFFVHCLWYTVS